MHDNTWWRVVKYINSVVQRSSAATHTAHTCSKRPSFMHDFMMSTGSLPPTMSDGATGPALMVLAAACRRLYGSVGWSLYGFPGCRGATCTGQGTGY